MRIFYCIIKMIRVKGAFIMAITNLTIRIDEDLKERLKAITEDMAWT